MLFRIIPNNATIRQANQPSARMDSAAAKANQARIALIAARNCGIR
jgi:hypothetical protein